MTDFDADEKVAPARPPSDHSVTDRALTVAGLVMAAGAALFPWYVFLNSDKFGIHGGSADTTRDLPSSQARNVFSVSPLAMADNTEDATPPAVDPVVTATVSKLGAEKARGAALKEEQPFPGKGGFRLLHVANGRAMIEDDAGMYMVQIGSILPDNSRVATLEQRDGKWVIVTSNGEVY
ncbi:flagellar protein [Rhizobiaceae bacterium n13]|uniref:Flagellar protein n=1 Tax=Ferirhizobium litorale TaxID=2927786 RepID=A0AAE3QEB1_9HYPH|nr:flagellar protein [Fererhizobium litorale]MDI7863395.1 flagellar protein [Fererhizobium litorale]MDI7922328.1 flagellar protein [Fererhizobium litorale]